MLVQCALYQGLSSPWAFVFNLKKHHFVYIVVVAGYAGHGMHGGQRTAHRSQFFLPPVWVMGIRVRPPPHLPVFVLKSSVIIYKLQPRLVSVCQPSALVAIRGMCHFLWVWPCLCSHAGSSQTIIWLSAGQAPVHSRFLISYKLP